LCPTFIPGQLFFHDYDQLVVEDKDESATDAPEDVGKVALEECAVTLILKLVKIILSFIKKMCYLFVVFDPLKQ
jgi:hypothetical protein